MSTSQNTGVALAVSHPQGTGAAGPKGGHVIAWRAQCKLGFDPTATLALIPGTGNPWRKGSEGSEFYTTVLAKGPKTVAEAYAMAEKAMGIKPGRVRQHLAWLYTDNGAYLLVDGQRWSTAPKAAPKAKVAKAKAAA